MDLFTLSLVFFGSSKRPDPPPPPPEKEDPEVALAIKKERELARLRKGRRTTILTGPRGITPFEESETLLTRSLRKVESKRI